MTGAQGNKSYRMALALYLRSSAAYKALNGFNIMQLPHVSSLTRAKLNEPGDAGDLKIKAEQYKAIQFVLFV